MDIGKFLYNEYSMPKPFSVEKGFDSWDPKIHGSSNYIQSFYVANIIDEYDTTKHYPLAMFQNGI